jgi:hypothetical protein
MLAPPSLQQAMTDGRMSGLGCTGFRAHWRCTAYNWWSDSGSPQSLAHQWRDDDDPSEYEAAMAALLEEYAHLDQEPWS